MGIYRGSGTAGSGEAIEVVDADNADITGGAIDGTTIGGTTPAAGTFTDLATTNPVEDLEFQSYNETVVTNATATGSVSVNIANGPYHVLTLTGNITLSFTNPAATGYVSSVTVEFIQDATGSRTITWPGSLEWDSGTAPTLTTSANAVSILTFWTRDGGTTWRGALVADNVS